MKAMRFVGAELLIKAQRKVSNSKSFPKLSVPCPFAERFYLLRCATSDVQIRAVVEIWKC